MPDNTHPPDYQTQKTARELADDRSIKERLRAIARNHGGSDTP